MNHIFNKSFFTNLIAVLIIVAGYLSPVEPDLLKSIGFFALSGAVTNWLAIHMLFEKVPFLYGSGVIPNRFDEFKSAIKDLMMKQFFTQENVEQFIEADEQQGSDIFNIDPILNAINYDIVYDFWVGVRNNRLYVITRRITICLMGLSHYITDINSKGTGFGYGFRYIFNQ